MDDEGAIRELLGDRYPACLNAVDIEGYVALYSDDVLWSVPNMPDATSPAEIGALLGNVLSKVTQRIELRVDDVLVEGDVAVATAVATGTVARKPDGDPQPMALRVMWALRRDGDRWQIIRQVGTPKPAG